MISRPDAFCRHCGKPQVASSPWYYEPVWILILAFAVLGPFALPLVWRTPKLGLGSKWLVTLGVALYTALLVFMTYRLAETVIHQWRAISEQLDQIRR